MKKIIGYLRIYFTEQCNYRYLLLLMLLVAGAIALNFRYCSEETFIKADPRSTVRLLKYLGGYFIIFGGAYGLQIATDPGDKSLRSRKLWGLILLAVVLFSVRAWYQPSVEWLGGMVSLRYFRVVYMIIINLAGFTFLFIPCFIYWILADRRYERLYGLTAKGVSLRPYFALILCMAPLLLLAGRQGDFQDVYPRAYHLGLVKGMPDYGAGTLAYECVYSLDYVVTEFFFRGFLILAIGRIVGYKAILPMCAFYVSIHFDKPLGECVSSFFGGMLLGILSYRTRSIYGGVIVHLGIALLMEAVGLWYTARPA